MAIKISDIMLDLATGDASVNDAYIQEAMGQVNVSSAIYEYAVQTASLNDAEREQIVQEAAAAGLPSSEEGALNLVYESVQNELLGTCRHLYMEMAKIDERATKATTPYAALNAMAKKFGCESTLDGSLEYAMEFAASVIKGDDITLADGTKFCKGSSAKKLTANLIQGVGLILNALCVDTDAFFEKKEIKAIVPAPVSTKCDKDKDGKDDCSLGFMVGALGAAKKYVKTTTLTDKDYTTNPTKDDVATVMACDTAVTKLAAFVKSKLGDYKGEYTEETIKKTIAKCNKKKVSSAAKDLNAKNDKNETKIVALNKDLHTLCTNLMKAFNDSADALVTSKSEGK
jgi:hypothetical protein